MTGVISGARDSTPPSIRGVTSPLGPLDAISISFDEPLRAETARRIADIRVSDEGREGIASFLNKREPAWKAA